MQASTSHLLIRWNGFKDIVIDNALSHHSGIAHYEYAIGSVAGGADIRDFTDVGVTNFAVAHGLALKGTESRRRQPTPLVLADSHTYYVTVRAFDYVGDFADATSNAITIDSSPPEVDPDRHVDIGGPIQTNRHMVSAWCVGLSSAFNC